MTRLKAVSLGLLATSVLVCALPASAGRSAIARTVKVQAGLPNEFAFLLSPRTVRRGTVTFVVWNMGQKPHDFTIRGKRTAVLAPGESAKLTVTLLKPGSYPYWCTVAGHAVAGMKGSLKVT